MASNGVKRVSTIAFMCLIALSISHGVASQSTLDSTEWGTDVVVGGDLGAGDVCVPACRTPSCHVMDSKTRSLPSEQGEPDTFEFRVFITADNYTVSPWHNVPLVAGNGTHTFVVEIPKNTSAKYEVQTVRTA